MTVLFENVNFLSGMSGATTKRTPAQRWGDWINVKDFGALGDGSTNDAAAILAAVTAMYAQATTACVLFFPPGNFFIGSTAIDISNHSGGPQGFSSGIITGSGKYGTTITGNIPNGFIFSQTDNLNGPGEISNIGFINQSTVIGSGCLLINNTSMRISDCSFQSMFNIFLCSNIYNVQIDSCIGTSNVDVTTGHTGTFNIAGGACNISGCRSTSPFQAGIQLGGAEPSVVSGNSNENPTIGLLVGMNTGWASSCTVSGTTLTVSGNLGSTVSPQFAAGAEIFMKGLTTTADWGKSPLDAGICTIVSQLSGTPGFAGTYQISRNPGTISSPVPCVSRIISPVNSVNFSGYGCEAAYYSVFALDAGDCTFMACGGSGAPTECVDAFGLTGYTPNSSFYVYKAIGCSFIACGAASNCYNAGWYFDPNQNPVVSLISCTSQKRDDNITGTTSTISNGSGAAGTILNILSFTAPASPAVGIGMRVFVSGSQVATVTGNAASDNTLTGGGGTGTYRVDISQHVTGSAITIKTGDDYILPSTNAGKTGFETFNTVPQFLPAGYTSGLNSLNRTFASLPGNVGSNTNIQVVDGMEYSITDGLAGNCADGTCTTWGTNVTGGGGALHLMVRYNAATAHWTLTGK